MSRDVSCVVGIDLGMTTTSIAVIHSNRSDPEILKDFVNSKSFIDSCVSFDSEEIVVGSDAADRKASGCLNTIFDTKCLIGQAYDSRGVQLMISIVPYKIVNHRNRPVIEVIHREQQLYLRPEDVSAEILKRALSLVERRLQGRSTDGAIRIDKAVITVPVKFDQVQKQAIIEAAKSVGLQNVTLLAESRAAAMAYTHDQNDYDNYRKLIFDLGGGSCNVSILVVENGEYRVVANGGDMLLGGRDFDIQLAKYVAAQIMEKFKVECEINDRLLRVCQKAKERLTGADKFRIFLNCLLGPPFNEETIVITREQFESECQHLAQRAINATLEALADARLKPEQIDEVIPVGGSSRIPMVLKMLGEHFEKLNLSQNATEAIAKGAAIYANLLDEQARNQCPRATSQFIDVTSLSLGLMKPGDMFWKIIPRGSRIPLEFNKTFVTTVNDQKAMQFDIYEGDCEVASKNTFLGTLFIDGLTPGTAGKVSATLTMEVDRSGILHATVSHNGRNVYHQIKFDDRSADAHCLAEENMLLTDVEVKVVKKLKLEKENQRMIEQEKLKINEVETQRKLESEKQRKLEEKNQSSGSGFNPEAGRHIELDQNLLFEMQQIISDIKESENAKLVDEHRPGVFEEFNRLLECYSSTSIENVRENRIHQLANYIWTSNEILNSFRRVCRLLENNEEIIPFKCPSSTMFPKGYGDQKWKIFIGQIRANKNMSLEEIYYGYMDYILQNIGNIQFDGVVEIKELSKIKFMNRF